MAVRFVFGVDMLVPIASHAKAGEVWRPVDSPGLATSIMPAVFTNSTQAKDREYAQLGRNLVQLSATMEETAQLMECMQADLQAMAAFASNTASQYVLSWSVSARYY